MGWGNGELLGFNFRVREILRTLSVLGDQYGREQGPPSFLGLKWVGKQRGMPRAEKSVA